MEIVLNKDPFEYRKFFYVVKYNNKKINNQDAEILIQTKICNVLSDMTKMKWAIRSCVGGKCTIATYMVLDRYKRKKWKGKTINFGEIPYLK
jgi:hypothetical protein